MSNKILFVLLTIVGTALLKEIPDYLHICKRSDPEFRECMRQSILYLQPYLAKGIPELMIPTVEPLILNETLVLNPSNGGNVGLQISVKDINVFGCSDFDVYNLNANFNKIVIKFDLKLHHLLINAQYNVDGRILLLPIKGNGKLVGNFSNSIGHVRLDCQIAKKGDQEYLKVNVMKLKIEVGKGVLRLNNLFGGDRILGDVINNVINDNFDVIAKEILPPLERELSRLFLRLTNGIVSQFTYAQLFPL